LVVYVKNNFLALSEYNGVTVITDETLKLFIDSAGGDSAGGQNRGFGIYFQGKWAQKGWSKDWEKMGIVFLCYMSHQ
jgi:hypothetical protein